MRDRERTSSHTFPMSSHDPRRRITRKPFHLSRNNAPSWNVGTEWDVPRFSGTLNVIMASASLRLASHGVSVQQVGKLGRELALISETCRVFLSHFLSVPCCRFLLPRHPMTLIPWVSGNKKDSGDQITLTTSPLFRLSKMERFHGFTSDRQDH